VIVGNELLVVVDLKYFVKLGEGVAEVEEQLVDIDAEAAYIVAGYYYYSKQHDCCY